MTVADAGDPPNNPIPDSGSPPPSPSVTSFSPTQAVAGSAVASFGVAGFSGEPDMLAENLYGVADGRLYIAKNAGRNRVVSSG